MTDLRVGRIKLLGSTKRGKAFLASDCGTRRRARDVAHFRAVRRFAIARVARDHAVFIEQMNVSGAFVCHQLRGITRSITTGRWSDPTSRSTWRSATPTEQVAMRW